MGHRPLRLDERYGPTRSRSSGRGHVGGSAGTVAVHNCAGAITAKQSPECFHQGGCTSRGDRAGGRPSPWTGRSATGPVKVDRSVAVPHVPARSRPGRRSSPTQTDGRPTPSVLPLAELIEPVLAPPGNQRVARGSGVGPGRRRSPQGAPAVRPGRGAVATHTQGQVHPKSAVPYQADRNRWRHRRPFPRYSSCLPYRTSRGAPANDGSAIATQTDGEADAERAPAAEMLDPVVA